MFRPNGTVVQFLGNTASHSDSVCGNCVSEIEFLELSSLPKERPVSPANPIKLITSLCLKLLFPTYSIIVIPIIKDFNNLDIYVVEQIARMYGKL